MITIRIDARDPGLLAIDFPLDLVGNALIGTVPGRRFSRSRQCWLVPNTRQAVVQIGQLFGKAYCRFDEAVVRLYKPIATAVEVEQATNPAWPPTHIARLPHHRKPFRYAPPFWPSIPTPSSKPFVMHCAFRIIASKP